MYKINDKNYDSFSHIYPYIRYCNEDYYISSWLLEERVIKDYEIIFILEGVVNFTIENKNYIVKKHQMLLIKPNKIHKAKSTKLPLKFFCIHFDIFLKKGINTALLDDYLSYGHKPDNTVEYEKGILELPEFNNIENAGDIEFLFKKIISENIKKVPGYKLMIQSLLVMVLFDIFRSKNNIGISQSVSSNTNKILNFIKQNYNEKLSLKLISENVYLQPSYISNLFKKETGMTINEFINSYRIARAKEMLLSSDLSSQIISDRTGFCDIHYFTKTFKKFEGLTPGQYRKIKIK